MVNDVLIRIESKKTSLMFRLPQTLEELRTSNKHLIKSIRNNFRLRWTLQNSVETIDRSNIIDNNYETCWGFPRNFLVTHRRWWRGNNVFRKHRNFFHGLLIDKRVGKTAWLHFCFHSSLFMTYFPMFIAQRETHWFRGL